jgi:hypothetical protein
MLKHVRSIVAAIARRFRSRSVLELENLALRHQLHVLRRQRPGRPRLFTIDRLLWIWFYRVWPRCLDTMVLVKPATVVQWHRQASACFGAGTRDPDGSHRIARFEIRFGR